MYGLAYEARKFNGERDYVWPLPTAELDTNKKLVQPRLVEVIVECRFSSQGTRTVTKK